MELSIELSFTTDEGNKIFHGHEPNNDFVAYYMNDERIGNKYSVPIMGIFTDLVFVKEPRRMTPHRVKDFGIKSFPRYGSYGFYTPKYGTSSIMVIPINREFPLTDAPVVTITDTGTLVHLDIAGPEYECYRIIVRNDDFAEEFITYDNEFDFLPMFDGECYIAVYGHSNEITVTSNPYEEWVTLVDRRPPIIPNTQRITLTALDWVGNSQTVNMAAVTPTGIVLLSPGNADYVSAGIVLAAQGSGTLTFTCATVPIVDIELGVVVL